VIIDSSSKPSKETYFGIGSNSGTFIAIDSCLNILFSRYTNIPIIDVSLPKKEVHLISEDIHWLSGLKSYVSADDADAEFHGRLFHYHARTISIPEVLWHQVYHCSTKLLITHSQYKFLYKVVCSKCALELRRHATVVVAP
jgi:hypothetical protein